MGGSWKLALRFLLAGETCSRREKSQAIAGPGHSIAVTSKGSVYAFGSNSSGQLGHGTTEEEWQPRVIRFRFVILEKNYRGFTRSCFLILESPVRTRIKNQKRDKNKNQEPFTCSCFLILMTFNLFLPFLDVFTGFYPFLKPG